MYATKRKFHNILASLSASASPSKAPSNNNASEGPEAKRRRTIDPYDAIFTTRHFRPRDSYDGMPMSRRDDRSTVQITRPAEEQRKLGNYAPWDRGQFLVRLKTFRHVDKWSMKPAEINEVQWAKRGWSCVGKERVGCAGGCAKEVFVKLEGKDEGGSEGEDGMGLEKELVRRYAELIVTEHDNNCPWKKHGCDETIHRLPLSHPTTAIGALGSRYKSLMPMESELPPNIVCPDGSDMNNVIATLPEDFLGSTDSETNGSTKERLSERINKDALALALLGWEAEETGHIKGLVSCNACFRRLGLWLFQTRQLPSIRETDWMQDEAAVTSLDVINEHREYCPWINSTSQNGDKSGWKILTTVLRTEHRFQNRFAPQAAISVPQAQQEGGEQGGPSERVYAPIEVEERSVRDQKDKERFAKLRRLTKVFDVKNTRKGKGKGKDIARKPGA